MSTADINNDALTLSSSTLPDQTMGGMVTQTNPGQGNFALAIIGYTTVPSVCMYGDSRLAGVHDNPGQSSANGSASPYVGEVARSIGPYFAFINMGTPGETAAAFVGSHTNRVALGAYCTHIISQYGTNDLAGGASAATLFGNQQTIESYFPGKPFFLTTVAPYTTSTDNWSTTTNQTLNAHNANYQSYNDTLRRGVGSPVFPGLTDIFDTDAIVEAGIGTGLWTVVPSPPSFVTGTVSFSSSMSTTKSYTPPLQSSVLACYAQDAAHAYTGTCSWSMGTITFTASTSNSDTWSYQLVLNVMVAFFATADGNHENAVGYQMIQNSGVINPDKIHW